MFIRFDVIHERVGRSDRQTDKQTLRDSKDRAYASHRGVKTERDSQRCDHKSQTEHRTTGIYEKY